MIVVDASVLANAVADDDLGGQMARGRVAQERPLHAPYLVDVEVLSVLRGKAFVGELDEHRLEVAFRDFFGLPMIRHPHLPLARRIWELRHNLTPYDAVYVALAETLDCPLVTADRGLANVPGARCEVEVIRAS